MVAVYPAAFGLILAVKLVNPFPLREIATDLPPQTQIAMSTSNLSLRKEGPPLSYRLTGRPQGGQSALNSQVENTNVSSAVEHTKTQLDRFQNNRFHDTGSDGDSSDE